MLWEEHIVLYETEQERIMEKKPIGEAYLPLDSNKEIQKIVFEKKADFAYSRPPGNSKQITNDSVFPVKKEASFMPLMPIPDDFHKKNNNIKFIPAPKKHIYENINKKDNPEIKNNLDNYGINEKQKIDGNNNKFMENNTSSYNKKSSSIPKNNNFQNSANKKEIKNKKFDFNY